MKTLKFTPQLVEKILSGEKTSTWRLFDDKDLKLGDELEFINKETLETFGYAKITSLKTKTLGTLTDEDWIGHEKFSSEEEMFKAYKKYYGDKVNKDSELKIITFNFKNKKHMHQITLHKQWTIKSPTEEVFKIMTDFEKFPVYFPKVAESMEIKNLGENHLEIDAIVKSFGKKFKVKMKTEILPCKGFISDNDSPEFGTSGHEEFLISNHPEGSLIDYTYQVTIHKKWLRVLATPLIKWYSMKYWEKAVIDRLKKMLEKQ